MFLYTFLGSRGRLGNNTQAEVVILSNDYPNGLFAVDAENTTKVLAEDLLKDGQSKTKGEITIIRTKGSMFAAKVNRFTLTAEFVGLFTFLLCISDDWTLDCTPSKNSLFHFCIIVQGSRHTERLACVTDRFIL